MMLLLLLLLAPVETDSVPWEFPAAPKIIAIGDVHGDLDAARRALILAGAMDDENRWVGGELVVVQTGDQLDRGDDEIKIVLLFEKLIREAAAAGGAFHVLNGNHELMNVYHDYRYVTDGAYQETMDYLKKAGLTLDPNSEKPREAARTKVFGPGGPMAKIFATRNTMVKVGDTLFVHGGILPKHARLDLGVMNSQVRAWCRGEIPKPDWVRSSDSPIWDRHYSNNTNAVGCALLTETLELLGAKRMVVGHTIQDGGINGACDDRIWRIDVGMAQHYHVSPPQVLLIEGDRITVLSEGENTVEN